MHLEQMQTYRSSIGDLMNTTWPPLDSMSKELEKNLERIAIRWVCKESKNFVHFCALFERCDLKRF